MASNLVGFTIISFVTVTWSLPPFNSQFKPSLHKRHNDELYADSAEDQSKRFLENKFSENRKFLTRRFNNEPDKESKPKKQQNDVSLFKKMEEVLTLLRSFLLQGSKFAKSLSEKISLKDDERSEKNCDTKKMKKSYLNEISTEE